VQITPKPKHLAIITVHSADKKFRLTIDKESYMQLKTAFLIMLSLAVSALDGYEFKDYQLKNQMKNFLDMGNAKTIKESK
jgi:hypothetical protein